MMLLSPLARTTLFTAGFLACLVACKGSHPQKEPPSPYLSPNPLGNVPMLDVGTAKQVSPEVCVVVDPQAQARLEPSANGEVVAEPMENTLWKVLGNEVEKKPEGKSRTSGTHQEFFWLRIELAEGKPAWIPLASCALNTESSLIKERFYSYDDAFPIRSLKGGGQLWFAVSRAGSSDFDSGYALLSENGKTIKASLSPDGINWASRSTIPQVFETSPAGTRFIMFELNTSGESGANTTHLLILAAQKGMLKKAYENTVSGTNMYGFGECALYSYGKNAFSVTEEEVADSEILKRKTDLKWDPETLEFIRTPTDWLPAEATALTELVAREKFEPGNSEADGGSPPLRSKEVFRTLRGEHLQVLRVKPRATPLEGPYAFEVTRKDGARGWVMGRGSSLKFDLKCLAKDFN